MADTPQPNTNSRPSPQDPFDESTRRTMEELMAIAGTAGLVAGAVLPPDGRYFVELGLQDVEKELPVTRDTMFPIFSLTKLATALITQEYIGRGEFTWDTFVDELLPEISFKDEKLHHSISIQDCLGHTTGTSTPRFYRGGKTSMLIAPGNMTEFTNDHTARQTKNFKYNNVWYKIMGKILERVSGASWLRLFQDLIVQDYRLMRTFLGQTGPLVAVSSAYNVLDDGTPVKLPSSQNRICAWESASGGMFSTVEDLMAIYSFVNSDMIDPDTDQLKKLYQPRVPIGEGQGHYCLGLAHQELPGRMGFLGMNPGLLPEGMSMPVVGDGAAPTTVYYHQGSGAGGLAAMAILPELDAVIVVLSNTLGLCDPADLVLQLLVNKLVGGSVPDEEFINVARAAATQNLLKSSLLEAELREDNLDPNDAARYVGTYQNKRGYFKIEVTLSEGRLFWALQGLESETYPLDPLKDDHAFRWGGSRNELASSGFGFPVNKDYQTVRFHVDAGEVTGLLWLHDRDDPASGMFQKLGEPTHAGRSE